MTKRPQLHSESFDRGYAKGLMDAYGIIRGMLNESDITGNTGKEDVLTAANVEGAAQHAAQWIKQNGYNYWSNVVAARNGGDGGCNLGELDKEELEDAFGMFIEDIAKVMRDSFDVNVDEDDIENGYYDIIRAEWNELLDSMNR